MTNRMIILQVNGEEFPIHIRSVETLLDALRERIGLTGAKPGCLNGDCGACTVNVDGEVLKSCIMLAVEAENKNITTIEGLQNAPMQEAFIEKFAFQCGYCTPGFIMNCHTLQQTDPNPTDATIKSWLESNVCRCTGYQEIEEAVKSVFASKSKKTL